MADARASLGGKFRAILAEAQRLLVPSGRLRLAALAPGESRCERVVTGARQAVRSLDKRLLGGCRPIEMERFLEPSRWRVSYHQTGSVCGVTSAVLIAQPLTGPVAGAPLAAT